MEANEIDGRYTMGFLKIFSLGCILGPIAQLVEHCADNAGVTGSIPVGPTMNFLQVGI